MDQKCFLVCELGGLDDVPEYAYSLCRRVEPEPCLCHFFCLQTAFALAKNLRSHQKWLGIFACLAASPKSYVLTIYICVDNIKLALSKYNNCPYKTQFAHQPTNVS